MEKEDKRDKLPYGDDQLYNINSMASSNDLTGLIPTPPQDDKEAQAYTQIYMIPTPQSESPEEIERRSKKDN